MKTPLFVPWSRTAPCGAARAGIVAWLLASSCESSPLSQDPNADSELLGLAHMEEGLLFLWMRRHNGGGGATEGKARSLAAGSW